MGLIDKFDPYKSAGKTLMWLNVLGMLFAAASDTYAAASDKNTSKEDKKFLIPAGICTGVAKIGIYLGMTKKITEKLEGDVFEKVINVMKDKDNPEIMSDEFNAKALKFVTGKIEKCCSFAKRKIPFWNLNMRPSSLRCPSGNTAML